jgi:hypothetical protein
MGWRKLSLGPRMPVAADRKPSEQPPFEAIQDINPCTGKLITLTFTGTARIHELSDHFTPHGYGTVVTSDGWTGTFNRQLIFHGERVATLRFHDMELDAGTASESFSVLDWSTSPP